MRIQKDKNIDYVKWEDIKKALTQRRWIEFNKWRLGKTTYKEGVFFGDLIQFLTAKEINYEKT